MSDKTICDECKKEIPTGENDAHYILDKKHYHTFCYHKRF